ncbi:hypothetical protein OG864_05575 [Streptomyces sp. NBC_00124]|uniref:hypothetical protein n=1 Tax=Streptomyces sp. NBC_00124 TaxID=2975662 RepID=UPI00225A08E6|nr:hypothetical protein [Streptomyces sp. NBC_00124]MCX5358164.1 hypothetical protein [Streptomyces sp. NBC_00124]
MLIEGERGVLDAALDHGSGWEMDPMTTAAAGLAAGGYILRLGHRWFRFRAQVQRAELAQRGLSERARSLPPGSRLIEKTAHHDVDILIGLPAAGTPRGDA